MAYVGPINHFLSVIPMATNTVLWWNFNWLFLILIILKLSSLQFSHSVMSDSLWTHGQQHARLPCLLPTPGAYTNSCLSSQWYYATISSVIPFSSHLQYFPASGSFPMSQFFTSGGPKYWSFSFSIGPSNDYSGLFSFRMDWLDLLSVQGTLKSLLQHHSSKTSVLLLSTL